MKNKIREKINYETSRRRSELNKAEIAFLWIMRAVGVFSLVYAKTHDRPSHLLLAITFNYTCTFLVSLLSIVLPRKLIIGRLPYKIQAYIACFAFLGSTIGQSLNIGWTLIDNYDKWLHFISGYMVVFMGYHIFNAIAPEREPNKKQAIFAGFGFTCLVALGWEVFEFMADYYIPGSVNQGYTLNPDYTMLFFKIFGLGAGNEGQSAVYDTMFDLLTALAAGLLAVVVFYIMDAVKTKIKAKNAKTEDQQNETLLSKQ